MVCGRFLALPAAAAAVSGRAIAAAIGTIRTGDESPAARAARPGRLDAALGR